MFRNWAIFPTIPNVRVANHFSIWVGSVHWLPLPLSHGFIFEMVFLATCFLFDSALFVNLCIPSSDTQIFLFIFIIKLAVMASSPSNSTTTTIHIKNYTCWLNSNKRIWINKLSDKIYLYTLGYMWLYWVIFLILPFKLLCTKYNI